jgi:hypothetical protein
MEDGRGLGAMFTLNGLWRQHFSTDAALSGVLQRPVKDKWLRGGTCGMVEAAAMGQRLLKAQRAALRRRKMRGRGAGSRAPPGGEGQGGGGSGQNKG